MDAGVRTTMTSSSILEKPLSQLTEDDISQLTREDCRNFLKEKGMRKPSWNKSQAIQQVISLKALLESNDDSSAGALRKIIVPPQQPSVPPPNAAARESSNSGDSVKEAILREEESPYRRKDPPLKPASEGEINYQGGDTDNKNLSPRSPCEANEFGGQMTIFYCGKVNVYDGVPFDKAQAIMHLAATPNDFRQGTLCIGNAASRSVVCHVQAAGDKNGLTASTALNPHSRTMQTDVDGQMSRKVSLQRYREKRKDRERFFKGRKNAGQTSGLEVYLNQQIRTQNSNGDSSRSSTNSPPQSGLPHAFCNSVDNQGKLTKFSVDLNDESSSKNCP